MADDKEWSPEGEHSHDDLLREHNKLTREMLDYLKGAKETLDAPGLPPGPRKAVEDLKARVQAKVSEAAKVSEGASLELERLRAKMESPPGQVLGVYRAPHLSEAASRLARIWDTVDALLHGAPEAVQVIAFQNLLHTSDDPIPPAVPPCPKAPPPA